MVPICFEDYNFDLNSKISIEVLKMSEIVKEGIDDLTLVIGVI